MAITPQICLGTAQFGMTYGITNKNGQVSQAEVGELLAQAAEAGICWLDTAHAYGNAETVIGRNLLPTHGYRIISKLSAQPQPHLKAQDADIWEQDFLASCQRLGVQTLDTLLLHSPADLSKPGGHHLEAWLLGLRERGLVKRIGVSIYSANDLEGVNPALLDMVQLPLSLFDQRLIHDGTLARLRASGTAIHARGLYLQGLLLTPAAEWPWWVLPEVRIHQQALESLAAQRGCRLIDLALGFARHQTDLEAVVVGVCNVQQLKDLETTWSSTVHLHAGECRAWALKDPAILDPRRWPC